MAIFTAEEIQRRWRDVLDRLEDEQCIATFSLHNSYYLSGLPMLRFGRFLVTMLFKSGEPVIIAPDFERDAVLGHSPITDIRAYRDEDGPTQPVVAKVIAEVLRECGVTRLATEAEGLPVSLHNLLTELLPDVTFADRTDAVDLVRSISSEEELTFQREASRLVDIGMQRVLELMSPGVSETELAKAAEVAMQEAAGADYGLHVSCYLQQGVRSAACHAGPSAATIEEGEFVEVVCEAEVNHYQASLERAIMIGDVSEEIRRACQAAVDAFDAALAAVRPGARFGDVDRASRKVLHEAGYERVTNGAGLVRSTLSHSGGRMESADLRHHNDRPLEPNMVVTIEPWAIAPGVGGPRVCDMVRVTETGYELMTKTVGGLVTDTTIGTVTTELQGVSS